MNTNTHSVCKVRLNNKLVCRNPRVQYLAFVPLLRRLREEFLFCPKRSVPHSIKTYKLSTVRVLLLPEWILPVNPTIGRLITSSPLWYCLINQFAVVSSRQKEKAIFCMEMTRQATERTFQGQTQMAVGVRFAAERCTWSSSMSREALFRCPSTSIQMWHSTAWPRLPAQYR